MIFSTPIPSKVAIPKEVAAIPRLPCLACQRPPTKESAAAILLPLLPAPILSISESYTTSSPVPAAKQVSGNKVNNAVHDINNRKI